MTKEERKEYMQKYRQSDVYKKNYEEKYKPRQKKRAAEFRRTEEYKEYLKKHNQKMKEYYEENKEKRREYYRKNQEKIKEQQKQWKHSPNGKISMNKWRTGYRERTGCNLYEPKFYTEEENQMILEHSIPDRELAEKLERSVCAIQHQRHRLKKTMELGEDWERRKW